MPTSPVFRSAFTSSQDETSGMGRRPVVFDVLGPDWETSLLPDDLKMVFHVNPSMMSVQHTRLVERIQTRGGFVEQHWGDAATEITFEQATGGFMRLYVGLSAITNPAYGGTRRETIAYDKFLDMLALFHNNGSVYDTNGNIVLQGILKLTFDGGIYLGWFSAFSVSEAADKPYQFAISATFAVNKEVVVWRSSLSSTDGVASSTAAQSTSEISDTPLNLIDTNMTNQSDTGSRIV
jgi:hypothetical protein